MIVELSTRERIARSALRLLFERQLHGVTGQAVADAAGVSRMTVYRYFPARRDLVQAALRVVSGVFAAALRAPQGTSFAATLTHLGEAIGRLPRGDLPTRLAEVRAAYPELYEEFTADRSAGLDAILERLLVEAQVAGGLRTDLDLDVARAFVREATVAVLASPALLARDVAPSTLFSTVKEILLHGLVERGASSGAPPERSSRDAT